MLADFSFGQNKRYVEEVALYHLDSLTKIDTTAFKKFKYFTDGSLSINKTWVDTFLYSNGMLYSQYIKSPGQYIKSSFKNLKIAKKKSLKSFVVPRQMQGEKSAHKLEIYHFLKAKDRYYVEFTIWTSDSSGHTAIIIINNKGDLIGYHTYFFIT